MKEESEFERLDPKMIEDTVRFLNNAFRNVLKEKSDVLGHDNSRGTKLHHYQTEFCYLINEIQRGYEFMFSKYVSDANKLIVEIKNLS